MSRILIKFILIVLAIGLVLFIGWWIILLSAFGVFDKDYSINELKENFEANQKEIYELRNYFNEIVPIDKFVEIEFDGRNKLGRFGILDLTTDSNGGREPIDLEWNLKINSPKMDTMLNSLGWTTETLRGIKKKLEYANCIQIESGEPCKIGFKRSGMGMYSFLIFNKGIPNETTENYNDSCRYIVANEKLVLEYGGGAIGSQCFYNFE